MIDHLRQVAKGRDDVRTECAGTIAGWWFAAVSRQGHELIAAGLLMLGRHTGLDELDKWVRVAWSGVVDQPVPYGLSDAEEGSVA